MTQISAGETGNSTIITAINRVELQKARKVLFEMFQSKTYAIPADVHLSSQSSKFQNFRTEQEKSMVLKIHFHPSSTTLEILGLEESVTKAIVSLEQFFESMRIKNFFWTKNLSPNVWKFMETYFDKIKKAENDQFLNQDATFDLEKLPSGKYQIFVKTTKENFPASENLLNQLMKKITERDEILALPGLKMLFHGKNGNDELKRIERNRMVYIKIQHPQNVPQLGIQRSATVSCSPVQSAYYRYNFTSSEGVKLSCRIGRIEDERVSIARMKNLKVIPNSFLIHRFST
jgi:hypothetical protein